MYNYTPPLLLDVITVCKGKITNTHIPLNHQRLTRVAPLDAQFTAALSLTSVELGTHATGLQRNHCSSTTMCNSPQIDTF